jgi:hypothetical protein
MRRQDACDTNNMRGRDARDTARDTIKWWGRDPTLQKEINHNIRQNLAIQSFLISKNVDKIAKISDKELFKTGSV